MVLVMCVDRHTLKWLWTPSTVLRLQSDVASHIRPLVWDAYGSIDSKYSSVTFLDDKGQVKGNGECVL